MIAPEVLPGFLVAVLAICLAPGPDQAFIVASAAAAGRRTGVLAAAGMALGMAVHTLATAAGLAVLLRSVPTALDVIQGVGAGYLLWLAVQTFRSLGQRYRADPSAYTGQRVLVRALVVNLANPKIIIFFASFLPQFVRSERGSMAGQLLLLGALFLAVGFVVDALIGWSAGRLRDATRHGSVVRQALVVAASLTYAVLAAVLVVRLVLEH